MARKRHAELIGHEVIVNSTSRSRCFLSWPAATLSLETPCPANRSARENGARCSSTASLAVAANRAGSGCSAQLARCPGDSPPSFAAPTQGDFLGSRHESALPHPEYVSRPGRRRSSIPATMQNLDATGTTIVITILLEGT
ncbi:hypothetical protein E2C01_002347 [Portunus trituberculatus]|uniref:Uncharacterized protein n=1 Tax=Portunus trituberculatus TaxID=210409 RepID=A0A5B7CKR6_PORTR|nr:hypothetical protein [Portunus trituberculatus]